MIRHLEGKLRSERSRLGSDNETRASLMFHDAVPTRN